MQIKKKIFLRKNYLPHNNHVGLGAKAISFDLARFTSAIISSSILTTCGDVAKAARANLRIRVTKIIARIKSDYFTVRHMDVLTGDQGRTGGGGGGRGERIGGECRIEEREISL